MAEVGGFIAVSYGVEDVDRYIVVYKKECGPSEDEMIARRNGEDWNAETAKKYEQKVMSFVYAVDLLTHNILCLFIEIGSKTTGRIKQIEIVRSCAEFELQRQIRTFDWSRGCC